VEELGLVVLGLLNLVVLSDNSPEVVRILQASAVVQLVLHLEARPCQDSVDRLLRHLVAVSLLHLASKQHLVKLHLRMEVSHQRLAVAKLDLAYPH
jgi:hypothetical protein